MKKIIVCMIATLLCFAYSPPDASAQAEKDESTYRNIHHTNYVVKRRMSVGTYSSASPDAGSLLQLGAATGDSTKAPLYLYPRDTADIPIDERQAGYVLFYRNATDTTLFLWTGERWGRWPLE